MAANGSSQDGVTGHHGGSAPFQRKNKRGPRIWRQNYGNPNQGYELLYQDPGQKRRWPTSKKNFKRPRASSPRKETSRKKCGELKQELASAQARLQKLAASDKTIANLEIKLKDADKKLRAALLAPRAEKQVLDLKEQLREAHAQLAQAKVAEKVSVSGETSEEDSKRIADLEKQLKDTKAELKAAEEKLEASSSSREKPETVMSEDQSKELAAAQAAAEEFEKALKAVKAEMAEAGGDSSVVKKFQSEASRLRVELSVIAAERNQLLKLSKDLQKKLDLAEQRASAAEVRARSAEGKLRKVQDASIWDLTFRRKAIVDA